ncbi:ribosome-associated ATPase/putative transporter RbbA [Aquabacterium parvum]|uniref:ribosome-associated ATPase/putative transporter RbbA n=1 Tax=Aquabacterium parvum TaxID=70584 RepID=UPI000718F81F|nr:ribosome-associated ATPase/putative transporter RbbA [Aquabacterium parvum]MBU0916950.1 ribosome-associated ATPase/putative transporter RbbA [Gammaproteobacteria bacterium]
MHPAVSLQDVSHRYGDTQALHNVTLSLPTGCTVGLVGPDGVGKSTLLSIVAGVKRIQDGMVEVMGTDLADTAARQRLLPRIAYMPQGLGRALYRSLSVYDNVDFAARLFGVPEAERNGRIRRLLAATGMAPFADRPAGKLSGGMKQKVALCSALVHDPDLLILDEPTTGVDPLSRRQFWALVEGLRRQRPHMTVLVATAYMEEAERFEHLVAMADGRVLVNAPTTEVLASTQSAHLEEAYIKLSQGGAAEPLVIPPLPDFGGEPAMEAQGLTRRFGDFTAVSDVNFRIERGEIFGFLGSNGCGKTTTMKMLTGLLDITEGQARLLGKPVDAGDLSTRLHIGYMSQLFSLYEELSVRQNLWLHARLYRMELATVPEAIESSLAKFDLLAHAEVPPARLSLGIRQRLQLAAACLHKPEVLILDEPTSGVDPAARDLFWRHLIRLSREEGVTLFVSTHFMNEAQRCDRISLMHHGRVLAVGAPQALCEEQGCETLEQAFIDHLEADAKAGQADPGECLHAPPDEVLDDEPASSSAGAELAAWRAWWRRMWAFARREAMELRHDAIRLTFAVLGPLIMLCAGTWGLSFDVDRIAYVVVDRDQSSESRELVAQFEGSPYFTAVSVNDRQQLEGPGGIDQALRSSDAWMVIDIPPGFGRDLVGMRHPEVAFHVDGANLTRATHVANNARAIALAHSLAYARGIPGADVPQLPVRVEPRLSFNQDYRSIHTFAPGVLMLSLTLVPAMLTALGVVREREMGTILNLFAAPGSVSEFLIGKQLPYIALTTLAFGLLVAVLQLVFGVSVQGSFVGLAVGAVAYAVAVTGLGMLVSAFVQTQVAAQFLTAIVCVIFTTSFAGLLSPVSTLQGPSRALAAAFPAAWFQEISLGTITKGWPLAWAPLWQASAVLLGFGVLYVGLARLLVPKQER